MKIVVNNLARNTSENIVTNVTKATQPIFLELIYGRVQDAESQMLYGIKQIPTKKEYLDQVRKPIENIIGRQTNEIWGQIYDNSVTSALDYLANSIPSSWVIEGTYEKLLLGRIKAPLKYKGVLFPGKTEYKKLAPHINDFTACQRYAASKLAKSIKEIIFELIEADTQRFGKEANVLDIGIYVIPY